ncbi:MAG: tail fiber domain-containing protein [Alphaproteobacteria bacterium]|nr:tail fiber domain-containing protein [Alphaproteobacteria bacterium]
MPRFFRREIFSPLSRSSHPRGFTLIELSIVMAIVGALVAGFLGAYKVMIAQEYLKTTKDRMNHIQQAMVRYQTAIGNTNQHLPCPAPLRAIPSAANFGMEDVVAGETCSTTAPSAPTLTDTFRATDILLPAGTNTVRVGGVPWKTLGLNEQDSYDSWGSRFLYAVSENLADPAPAPAYSAGIPVITIKGPSGTALPTPMPFVLISFGKSRFGSVTTEGKSSPIACPAVGTPEGDNCDWATPNTTFGERTYSEASDPNFHFDDYIVYSLDNISGGDGGAKNIATLEDGMSDWPAKPPLPFSPLNPLNTYATNVFLGKGSGGAVDDSLGVTNFGTGNTGVGINALTANTTGSANTAMGMDALAVNSDQHGSTAIGYWAMRFAYNGTTGYNVMPYNTAVGAFALQGDSNSLTVNKGTSNTAVGYGVLQANTIGNNNTGTGAQALYKNNVGSANTANGAWALHENDGGAFNTAEGYQALQSNAKGGYNTAAGAFALNKNTGGTYNTAIGISAMFSNDAGYYNTAGGAFALLSNDGTANTALGTSALQSNQTGGNNTAVGYNALYYNTNASNNTAVGYSALQTNNGPDNTAVGYNALISNTTAKGNTAVGYNALLSNTTNGDENTAVGTEALLSNTNGIWNTAVGVQALKSNTMFGANTAVGHQALYSNDAGNNTAAGYHALFANTSGQMNTAMGVGALQMNQTGAQNTAVGVTALGSGGSGNSNNTAVGMSAMELNTGNNNTAVGTNALAGSGSNNTAIGYWAGTAGSPYAGNNNTYIGYLAVPGANNLTNATAIGNGAVVNASNTVQIGNAAVTDVYLGTSGGTSTGDTASFTGAANNATVHAGHYNSPSDLRLKKDIKDSDLGLDFIEKLRPVSYFYKTGDKPMSYGFIAQEVEKALGERAASMVTWQNDEMKTYELNYSEIISPLVKAVQEIVAKFHELEKTVAALIAKFNPLEKTVQEQENIITQQQEQIQALTRSMAAMKSEMDALRK